VSVIVKLVALIVGLIVSAQAKLHAVILGQPVSVPVLWLVAAVMVLALAAVVLWLLRAILREGLRLRVRTVRT
jgi:hypothetical protein